MSATPRQPQVRETEDLQVEHPQSGDSRPAEIFIGGRIGRPCESETSDQMGEDCADRDEFGLNSTQLRLGASIGPPAEPFP